MQGRIEFVPCRGELRLFRQSDNKLGFRYRQACVIEESLDILHAEKPDMRSIKESGIAILDIFRKQSGDDRIMPRMRNGDDDVAIPCEPLLDTWQRRPWLVKMLQYVCHDDDIEFRFVRENFSPGGVVEIGAVDAFAERCEGCNDLFVDLDGRDTAAEGIAQNTRH